MELQIIKSLNEPMFKNGRIQADCINHAANCFWDWTKGNRQDIAGFADELIRCSECVRNNMVMFSSTWLLALKYQDAYHITVQPWNKETIAGGLALLEKPEIMEIIKACNGTFQFTVKDSLSIGRWLKETDTMQNSGILFAALIAFKLQEGQQAVFSKLVMEFLERYVRRYQESKTENSCEGACSDIAAFISEKVSERYHSRYEELEQNLVLKDRNNGEIYRIHIAKEDA